LKEAEPYMEAFMKSMGWQGVKSSIDNLVCMLKMVIRNRC
jgi:hypothetical protein